MKKIFLFTTECSLGGIEREYIAELFNYLELKGLIQKSNYHYKFLNTKEMNCPDNSFKFLEKYLRENKKEIKGHNVIPCVIIDKDNDRKFSEALRQKYIKNNIHLFLSKRSFEQWIEFHISNKEISNLNGLGNNNKEAYKKSIPQIMNTAMIKQAYNNAKNRCISADDNILKPYCLNYTGSDMFAFIDLIHSEFNIKMI